MSERRVRLSDLLREAEARVKNKNRGRSRITVEFPSRVYMLCCEAAQKKKPGLIDALMRSDERLSREDRAHIADFYAGKFSNPSGRPENPRRQWELARLADMVKELKQVAREKGVKLKHDDAIEHVVTSWGGPDEYDTLKNYIRRSKQTKKVAR